jgi:hypothetical protein
LQFVTMSQKLNLMLSSDCSEIGTGSSNSPRSAKASGLYGFSARSGRIARGCGLICVTRGTGEKHFPPIRAQDVAKVSVGK